MARTIGFRLLGASALLLTGCYSDTTEPLDLDDAAVAMSQGDAAVASDAGRATNPEDEADDCEAITDPIQQFLCTLTGGDPEAQGGLEDLVGGFLGGRGRDAGSGGFGDFGGQLTEEDCRDPSDAITRFLCGRMTRRDAGSTPREDAAVPPEQPVEQDAGVGEPSDAAVEVDAALPFSDAGDEQDAGLPLEEDASTDGGVEDPALVLLDATVSS